MLLILLSSLMQGAGMLRVQLLDLASLGLPHAPPPGLDRQPLGGEFVQGGAVQGGARGAGLGVTVQLRAQHVPRPGNTEVIKPSSK